MAPPPNRGPKGAVGGGSGGGSGGGTRSRSKRRRPEPTVASGALKPLLLLAAGAALVPLARRVRAFLEARMPRGGAAGDDGAATGARGDAKKKRGTGMTAPSRGGPVRPGQRATKAEPMRRPPGAAPVDPRGGAGPPVRSSKAAKNKRAKQKAAERAERRRAEEDLKPKPGQLPGGKSGRTVVVQKGNDVPKDEDIVGGEAGKTFTTTSHVKVPTWYAKVREERGND